MKSDSGRELGEIRRPKRISVATAIKAVDAWGSPGEGDFRVHMIARALRAEIARLQGKIETSAATRGVTCPQCGFSGQVEAAINNRKEP